MRRARIRADGSGYYHGMSWIIERRYIFGDAEKQRFFTPMKVLGAGALTGSFPEGFLGNDLWTHALLEGRMVV